MSAITNSEQRKEELERLMGEPGVLSDRKKMAELSREYKRVSAVVEHKNKVERLRAEIQDANKMISDSLSEISALAQAELERLIPALQKTEQELDELLVPPDPIDAKDAIIEIRAGTGGEEAALFGEELARAYLRFAETLGLKTQMISQSRAELGGIKEVIFEVNGDSAYGNFRFESGVHRVQRIPITEKAGRVHTSTITVAVLPKVEEEDFKMDPQELDIQATTSSGAGGQSVNTTYSAIRIIHKPTGLIVTCQDERSQSQNKAKAMEVMRARLFEKHREEKQNAENAKRLSQIGTGERSEKIRTYNFPQDRVTDHRIQENWGNIRGVMEGNLSDIVTSLKKVERNQAGATSDKT